MIYKRDDRIYSTKHEDDAFGKGSPGDCFDCEEFDNFLSDHFIVEGDGDGMSMLDVFYQHSRKMRTD